MQFGINKHKLVQGVQFEVFEKIYKCIFIFKLHKKIIWLLVNNMQVTISAMPQCFTRQMKGQDILNLLDENLTIKNSGIKLHSLSQSHIWKQSSFFSLWKAAIFHSWIDELDPKQKKTSLQFHAAFFTTVFLSGWKILYREEILQFSTSCFLPRNESITYHETDFLSIEGHVINFIWLLPDFTSSLDTVQVRFAFVAFKIKTRVLLRILLQTLIEFEDCLLNRDFVMPSQSALAFQVSQIKLCLLPHRFSVCFLSICALVKLHWSWTWD